MNSENTTEDATILSDRQLLEHIFNKITAVEDRLTSVENQLISVESRLTSVESRVDSLERNVNVHFENFNQRLLGLEVQTETLTSLAYQALLVAHAVKGDVRALREESSSHGREISELQRKLLSAA